MNEPHPPETAYKFCMLSYLLNCFFVYFMIYLLYWNYYYFKYWFILFASFWFYIFILTNFTPVFFVFIVLLYLCVYIYTYTYIFIYICIYKYINISKIIVMCIFSLSGSSTIWMSFQTFPQQTKSIDEERQRISHWNRKVRFVPRILRYPPEKLSFQYLQPMDHPTPHSWV